MKTPMQDLIDTIDKMIANGGHEDLLAVKQHALNSIEKEKNEIIEAHRKGCEDYSGWSDESESVKYYNEKYISNENPDAGSN